MAQQYKEAVEALRDPKLREEYSKEEEREMERELMQSSLIEKFMELKKELAK